MKRFLIKLFIIISALLIISFISILFYNKIYIVYLSHYEVGDIDKNGRLVILKYYNGIENINQSLVNDYGIMVEGDDGILFSFYKQKTKEILYLKNVSELKEQINKIPKGETVNFYDFCSSPLDFLLDYHKIDKNLISDIKNICKKNGSIYGKPIMTCLCK